MSWLATPTERAALLRRVQRREGSARVFDRYAAQREQMAEDADDEPDGQAELEAEAEMLTSRPRQSAIGKSSGFTVTVHVTLEDAATVTYPGQ